MKTLVSMLAAVVGLLLLAGISAEAAGSRNVTLVLDQAEPVVGDATFTVTQQNYKNPHLLWVAVKCTDGEDVFTAEYHPVVWNADASAGTTDRFALTGTSCTAYVWEFPASEDPERVRGDDVAFTFTVAP